MGTLWTHAAQIRGVSPYPYAKGRAILNVEGRNPTIDNKQSMHARILA
jgi:hypothetical protein